MGNGLIVSDPSVLGGKACVRGTRLSVDFLLELAASGATQDQILRQYPQLTAEGLAAAFQYAALALKGRTDLGAENHGVKPFAFPFLTDENIGPDVVAGLRERGCDVREVIDEGLTGSSDKDVFTRAVQHVASL
jgi:uncharacterized protein (DUF433 family)